MVVPFTGECCLFLTNASDGAWKDSLTRPESQTLTSMGQECKGVMCFENRSMFYNRKSAPSSVPQLDYCSPRA